MKCPLCSGGGEVCPDTKKLRPPILCPRCRGTGKIDFTTPLVFSAQGTAAAVLRKEKDVTRRIARPGETPRWRVGARSRIYSRSPRVGGKPIGEVQIVDVRKEPLDAITHDEVRREGFPDEHILSFLRLFKSLHPAWADRPGRKYVWRIEFRLLIVYPRGSVRE